MDNKKALRMAVTLAIINMPLLAQAADVSPVRITDGSTYTMTADSVINTGSNTTGIFVGYKDGGTIVGDNVTVTSDGYGIQIQTYATGGVAGSGDCSIKLGKTIVEAKSSAVRVDSSSYGQKATVILGAGSILNSSANSAVYVTGKDSLLQIGDGSTVTGNSYGATGAALASSSGGKIEIGNGVTIGHDNIRGYDVFSASQFSLRLRYYRWMAMRAKAKVILQSATTVRFMPKGKVMAQMPFRRAIYHILVLTVLVLNRGAPDR